MIRISFTRDTPLETRRELRAFCTWLQRELDVRDEVSVAYCDRIYGYFDGKGRAADATAAVVATGFGLGHALLTTAHEMVHYEQLREDVDYHERGVDRRAAHLVEKWQRSRSSRS